jgi:preprotein translocase subunit SecA
VFATVGAKWDAVTAEAQPQQRAGQPVLIGTRSIADSLILSEHLAAAGVGHQVLNGRQDTAEADLIARAGRAGCVTVATNMAGRGTDIRPDAAALAAGGLHVIGTEHHDSRRVDRQLVGRAARQGEPGTAHFIVSADDRLLARDERLRRLVRHHGRSDGAFPFDLSGRIERLQRAVEAERYRQRRQLLEDDRRQIDDLARWYGG